MSDVQARRYELGEFLTRLIDFLTSGELASTGMASEIDEAKSVARSSLTKLRASLQSLQELDASNPARNDPTLINIRHGFILSISSIEDVCKYELMPKVQGLSIVLERVAPESIALLTLGQHLQLARSLGLIESPINMRSVSELSAEIQPRDQLLVESHDCVQYGHDESTQLDRPTVSAVPDNRTDGQIAFNPLLSPDRAQGTDPVNLAFFGCASASDIVHMMTSRLGLKWEHVESPNERWLGSAPSTPLYACFDQPNRFVWKRPEAVLSHGPYFGGSRFHMRIYEAVTPFGRDDGGVSNVWSIASVHREQWSMPIWHVINDWEHAQKMVVDDFVKSGLARNVWEVDLGTKGYYHAYPFDGVATFIML